jgi:hypothetical protein
MALLQKIRTLSRRIVQLEGGTGNNQPARASDVNPIITWVNDRSDINTVANVATGNTPTLNAISGTITTAALTTGAGGSQTITVTNAYSTANSTILAIVSSTSATTGVPTITRVTPSAGSFVVIVGNAGTAVLNGTVTFKFIIL